MSGLERIIANKFGIDDRSASSIYYGKGSSERADGGNAMAWDESFTCDICGTTKLASNHWWMISLGDVFCFEEGQPARHFTLTPWDTEESRNPKVHHICGEGCANKALERFMARGTLAPEIARSPSSRTNIAV